MLLSLVGVSSYGQPRQTETGINSSNDCGNALETTLQLETYSIVGCRKGKPYGIHG